MAREYVRITSGAMIYPEEHPIMPDGSMQWNLYTIERIRDYTWVFQTKFTDLITRTIGDEWAISFVQVSPETLQFFVDIYLDDKSHFNAIKNIVEAGLDSNFSCTYFLRGNIDDYTGNRFRPVS